MIKIDTATLNLIKHALNAAVDALEIADDWGIPKLQLIDLHPMLGIEQDEDGWVNSRELAQKLREISDSL